MADSKQKKRKHAGSQNKSFINLPKPSSKQFEQLEVLVKQRFELERREDGSRVKWVLDRNKFTEEQMINKLLLQMLFFEKQLSVGKIAEKKFNPKLYLERLCSYGAPDEQTLNDKQIIVGLLNDEQLFKAALSDQQLFERVFQSNFSYIPLNKALVMDVNLSGTRPGKARAWEEDIEGPPKGSSSGRGQVEPNLKDAIDKIGREVSGLRTDDQLQTINDAVHNIKHEISIIKVSKHVLRLQPALDAMVYEISRIEDNDDFRIRRDAIEGIGYVISGLEKHRLFQERPLLLGVKPRRPSKRPSHLGVKPRRPSKDTERRTFGRSIPLDDAMHEL